MTYMIFFILFRFFVLSLVCFIIMFQLTYTSASTISESEENEGSWLPSHLWRLHDRPDYETTTMIRQKMEGAGLLIMAGDILHKMWGDNLQKGHIFETFFMQQHVCLYLVLLFTFFFVLSSFHLFILSFPFLLTRYLFLFLFLHLFFAFNACIPPFLPPFFLSFFFLIYSFYFFYSLFTPFLSFFFVFPFLYSFFIPFSYFFLLFFQRSHSFFSIPYLFLFFFFFPIYSLYFYFFIFPFFTLFSFLLFFHCSHSFFFFLSVFLFFFVLLYTFYFF